MSRACVVAGAVLLIGCGERTLPSDEGPPGLPLGWLSYTDDGTLIAASRWRVVRLDPQLNEIDRTVPPYPFDGDIQGLTFFGVSRDGRVAAYGWQSDDYRTPATIDAGAMVFEVPSGNRLRLDPYPQTNFEGVSLSPDGRTEAVVPSPQIQITSVADGQLLWQAQKAGWSPPLFTPDSAAVIVASGLDTLEVVRASDGGHLAALAPPGHNATMAVAVSADGSTVAASSTLDSAPDVITMWRLPDGAPVGTATWPADLGGLPVSIALSPRGDRVAATVVPGGPQNDSLVVWEGERLLYRRDGETDWAVAFSPDGETLAVANAKQGVRLLRASDGAVLAQRKILADAM
jgi:WD40 repeat protein